MQLLLIHKLSHSHTHLVCDILKGNDKTRHHFHGKGQVESLRTIRPRMSSHLIFRVPPHTYSSTRTGNLFVAVQIKQQLVVPWPLPVYCLSLSVLRQLVGSFWSACSSDLSFCVLSRQVGGGGWRLRGMGCGIGDTRYISVLPCHMRYAISSEGNNRNFPNNPTLPITLYYCSRYFLALLLLCCCCFVLTFTRVIKLVTGHRTGFGYFGVW